MAKAGRSGFFLSASAMGNIFRENTVKGSAAFDVEHFGGDNCFFDDNKFKTTSPEPLPNVCP